MIPLYVWQAIYKDRKGSIKFSSIAQVKKLKKSLSIRVRYLPLALRSAAILFIIVSLARPQKGIENTRIPTKGIDIILALDLSTSMLAEDFTLHGHRINRLAAIKDVVKKFISERRNDRIGIVVFAGRAYIQCPLTVDYGILLELLDKVKIGMVEDGTAIGEALAVCLNHIKDIPAKSKVIILLTDGRNNMGSIDPLTGAEMAKALGVKIYTIGAGTKGLAPYPMKDFFGNKVYQRMRVDIDEDTLKQIANITGGEYFRATDTKSLKKIYAQINNMEKTNVEVKIYTKYKELFPYFLIPGLFILLSEMVITNTWLRRIP